MAHGRLLTSSSGLICSTDYIRSLQPMSTSLPKRCQRKAAIVSLRFLLQMQSLLWASTYLCLPPLYRDEWPFKGLSIRKRFRASSRHNKGKGLVISIQTIAGHTLFACTVGDLGSLSGIGDVSLDSWACLEGMINVVKRTGHSSFYVEKGMNAMGKTPKQMGIQGDSFRVQGGGKFIAH